jgi:hypothetical protein
MERKAIFEKSVQKNLDKCLEGYNFSALAYGQTVFLYNSRVLGRLIQWELVLINLNLSME